MSPWGNENRVSFKALLNSKLYSDLTLVCDGKEFPVHKAIVCTQSPVLSGACSNFKEASENLIKVTEFDADTVYRMLEFLYTGEYTAKESEHISYEIASASYYSSVRRQDETGTSEHEDNDANPFENNNNNIYVKPEPDFSEWMADEQPEDKADRFLDMLHPHISANAIGDYYLIPALKERANVMIYSALRSSWSAMGFLRAVKQIFDVCGDKELHAIVTEAATKHLDELAGMDEFANMSDMPGASSGARRMSMSGVRRSIVMKSRK